MAERVRGVLFDLDGTLLDHEAAVRGALVAWLSTYRIERTAIEPLVPAWLDLEQRHYPAWRSGEISFGEQRRRRLRDFLPLLGLETEEDRLDDIFADYLRAYEQHWRAYPDARPALEKVAEAGLRVGVLTNGLLAQQTAKLEITGLLPLCGRVFASSELDAPKPDPRAYLAACRGLRLRPAAVLMIGDHYEIDVLGARAAGLTAVHLDRRGQSSRPEDERVTTLRDLPI